MNLIFLVFFLYKDYLEFYITIYVSVLSKIKILYFIFFLILSNIVQKLFSLNLLEYILN